MSATPHTTDTTGVPGATVRPLPDDSAERLQARTTAARLAAEALDAQHDALSKEEDALDAQVSGAWAVVHAYEHTQDLSPTAPIDNGHGPTLTTVEAERVLWLLANVTWIPRAARRFDHHAAASLDTWHPGAGLRYTGHRLEVVTGCPSDPDHHHVATVRSQVQLAWALDHLHRPDHPRWVCDGPCQTSTTTDLDPGPKPADDAVDSAVKSGDGDLDTAVRAVGTAFNGEVVEAHRVDQAHHEASVDRP